MTEIEQWLAAYPGRRPEHDLAIRVDSYGTLYAVCSGCDWRRCSGTEPLALTSYWHWAHQLEILRRGEYRAGVIAAFERCTLALGPDTYDNLPVELRHRSIVTIESL